MGNGEIRKKTTISEVSELLSLKEFLEKQKCKKSFRDDRERKKYITQTLNLQALWYAARVAETRRVGC